MLASLAIFVATAASLAGIANAQISPLIDTSFNQGEPCTVTWEVDPTGTWKQMHIQIMTGDNFQMVHLSTLATVDGTDPSKASYTWTCPEVDPYSAIYFYQFSSPASKELVWTTRFTIADKNGNSVPPPNKTQPGTNAEIPWGTGRLLDQSLVKPAPTDVGSQVTGSASGSASASASASGSSVASGPGAPSSSSAASASVAPTAGSGSSSVAVGTGAPVASSSGLVKVSSSSGRVSPTVGAVSNASASATPDDANGAASVRVHGAGALTAVALVGAAFAALL